MEEISIKKSSFEYLLNELLKWFEEVAPQKSITSFTRVKTLKLLFFVSAVKDENGKDLLDVFDKFYAMPHGPVESDIYNFMSTNALDYFSFTDIYMSKKATYENQSLTLPDDIRLKIDKAVSCLRLQNQKIITLGAFELVDISHKWSVWKNSMRVAELLGKSSQLMPVEAIRSNVQIFV